ncbi:transcriptional regulator with XRE-family HTH domain [Natronobacillus azotifigens]|uniref:Helix-turn-helix transcriptional regulator n=1 Tax=Natronobacillus azotifigens TaxID=472978 RepID=A0A9J6RD00_9BACI|nr:helix-turn-helix transcriptional regulator [Natronobacillus azotifigens]MCZ0703568.1 helix-turn-helix transcriptional regulator [Natronobacillus azotifigens]
MDSTSWGRRVKAFRKLKGYTQIDFAKSIGVSVSVVGEIERGKRVPSEEFLLKTSETLDIAIAELKPK